jgi:segregation and condensation protein B
VSRKRGKQRKAPVEAVPEDILAEGSGPVHRIGQDAIATVDDVVTTDDIATTEDVVTADDIVATPVSAGARSEPEPEDAPPKRAGRSRKPRRAGRASAPGADDAECDAPRGVGRSDAPADAPEGSEIDAADRDGADRVAGGETDRAAGDDVDRAGGAVPGERAEDVIAGAGPADAVDAGGGGDTADVTASGEAALDGESAQDELRTGATEGTDHGADLADTLADDEGGDTAGDGAAGDDDDAAGVFPTSAATMDAVQLKHLVEALIFASDRPVTVQRLRQLTRVSDVRRLQQALSEIAEDYGERGLVLQQVSGGFQFRTRTQFSPWVQQLIAGRPVRLSRAQLETLAIIAYRQPITRPEIDDIRGVDSTATLKLLIDRALIRVLGKREEVGRPMLYGTTKEFLDFFSLGDLRELPTLREYSELTAESRKVMSDRLGIAADGSDGPGERGEDPEGGSGNGHGGNGHGGNGHGGNGHGGDDGGGGGPSGPGGGGGGLSEDGASASPASGGRAAVPSTAEDGAGATSFAEHPARGAGAANAANAAEDGAEVSSFVQHPAQGAGAVNAAEDSAGAAEADAGASAPAEAAGAETAAAVRASAEVAAVTAAEGDARATASEEGGELADARAGDDAPVRASPDEVSDLSAFWAASDAVDRSSAAALGDSDDDGPADTWFDPSLGDSLDDLVDADDVVEPGEARGSSAGPPAAE